MSISVLVSTGKTEGTTSHKKVYLAKPQDLAHAAVFTDYSHITCNCQHKQTLAQWDNLLRAAAQTLGRWLVPERGRYLTRTRKHKSKYH